MANPDRDTVYTNDGANRTVYTRESNSTGWFVGIIVALALLAIAYLVFSANSQPSSTTIVNTPPVTNTAPADTTTTPMAPADSTTINNTPAVTAPADNGATTAPAANATTPAAPSARISQTGRSPAMTSRSAAVGMRPVPMAAGSSP